MTENQTKPIPNTYIIKIEGYLEDHWSDWFEGLTFTYEINGTTILHGPLPDQAALHGILEIIRDLNINLISVSQSESNQEY
jgi:hypothetical protein